MKKRGATWSGRATACAAPGRCAKARPAASCWSRSGGAPRRLTPEQTSDCTTRPRVLAGLGSPLTYTGRWREMVSRSAITLKLMTYAPTGAPSRRPPPGCPSIRRRAELGLPVHLGQGRLVLHLRAARPGLHRGGGGVRRLAAGPAPPSRPAASGPAEDHVPGGRKLRPDRRDARPLRGLARLPPVRIGNGAADQLQLDIYGEAMDSIYLADPAVSGRPSRLDRLSPGCRLGVRALGPAGRGYLGDPRRPEGLHLRPAPVLDRPGPGDQDGATPRPAGQPRALGD